MTTYGKYERRYVQRVEKDMDGATVRYYTGIVNVPVRYSTVLL